MAQQDGASEQDPIDGDPQPEYADSAYTITIVDTPSPHDGE